VSNPNVPDLQSLARALGGVVSGGQVLAPGPGHSAEDRSLSVKLDTGAPDGFIVNSFAKDNPIECKDYVRAKTGITSFKPNGKRKPVFDIDKAIAAQSAGNKSKGSIVTTYDYTDESGELLYQVCRLEPKEFRQRRPDGMGGWIWNLGSTRRVPYRWPELLKFPDGTVFVTEGEKDADRVASLGHCATTAACGKWTEDCIRALAARDILILEDNDEAGRKKATEAAHVLHGTARTVRIVRLPNLPDKGDVSDWLDADARRAEKLVEASFDAPVWTPKDIVTEAPPSLWRFHTDQDPEPTAWLIKGVLPEAGTALVSGMWGSFKTTLALDITVSVITGEQFAGRFPVKRKGGVAYIAVEGAAGLSSRLTAIARARGAPGALPFAYSSDCPPLTAPDALDKLTIMVKDAAKHLKDRFGVPLVAVFVDTVVTAAGYAKAGDDNDAAVAQKLMSVMSGLSQRTGALVAGVDHFGKVEATGTRGSSAKEGAADSVLALLCDRELSGTVSNTRLAIRKQREGVAGLELPFIPTTVEIGTDRDGEPITRTIITWEPTPAAQAQTRDKDWSRSLRLLRQVLMAALADGKDMQPFPDGPVVRACDLEVVRAEFSKQYPANGNARQKADARRKAFQRAVEDAQGRGLVGLREVEGVQFVWLARPGGRP
jgi:AAA domain/Toprim-like